MQEDLRRDYDQIGKERDAASREADRERFWFFVRVAGICVAWVVAGAALMGQALHINAVVGPFYFPDLMNRAQLYFQGGVALGTAGCLGTLIWAWRTASHRGYLD